MSNLDARPTETLCGGAHGGGEPVHELVPGRRVQIGPRNTLVTRTLPSRTRRTVGAWCFLDSFGPEAIGGTAGMQVPPHPHCGLQTVTWLVDGEVLHRDSLGTRQLITPGELNLMSAGRGISHSEESPPGHSDRLHGLQLWVALPAADRAGEPHFEHHADLPVITDGAARITVMVGEPAGAWAGVESAARRYSPLLALEVTWPDAAPDRAEAPSGLTPPRGRAGPRGGPGGPGGLTGPAGTVRIPLDPAFEHAVLTVTGSVQVDGAELVPGPMLYLGTGRRELTLTPTSGPGLPKVAGDPNGADAPVGGPTRVVLLGGEPFGERLVMWWNFVGRDHDEIAKARDQWQHDDGRFGTVYGYAGDRLPAPTLPNSRLTPR